MWNQKDRFLMGLFAVQLIGAVLFGLIVANSLSDVNGREQTITVADGGTGAVVDANGGTTTSDGTVTGSDTSGGTSDGAVPGDTTSPGTTSDGSDTGTSSDGSGSGTGQAATPGQAPSSGASSAPGQPASGGEGTRTGITKDTIKIGVLVTQTGAINFRSSAQATKAFVDEVNEAGGIHGRKIEMILRDDSLDKNKGTAAVEEMIQAGVFAFVAFNAPLSEQDIIPIIEKHKIPLIGAFAIPATPYGYIFSGPNESYGRVGGARLVQEGAKTPALVYISNNVESTDSVIRESWRLSLKEGGVELSDDNIFPVDVTKTSYDDVVTQMRINGVDGFGSVLDATAMKRLQQSMNRASYRPLHVTSPFGGDPSVLQDPNVGASFEGAFVLTDIDFLGSGAPEVTRYETQTKRRFGAEAQLDWAGEHGWLGTKMFTDAMNLIGPDPTRERLLAQMNSFNDYATGMTSNLKITEKPLSHRSNNRCIKTGKVVNGKVQQIKDWVCTALTLGADGVG